MASRIRVFFINCPNLDTAAATHLLLAQNRIQSTFQFELYHFWVFSFHQSKRVGFVHRTIDWLGGSKGRIRQWADRKVKARLDLKEARVFKHALKQSSLIEETKALVEAHDKWFKSTNYNKYDVNASPAIVVTETPIEGNFLSFSSEPDKVGLISLDQWKNWKAPSALEYVLHSVQRLSLRLTYGSVIGSHYPTRGCVWDFDVHQPDSRISTSLGWICETCTNGLRQRISEEQIGDISKLISGDWFGTLADPNSVAGALSRIHSYDLTRATGLNPGFWSFLPKTAGEETVKVILDILKWIVILLLTVLIIGKFPTLAKVLQR